MVYYFYTNVLGTYIYDESAKLADKSKIDTDYKNIRTISKGGYTSEEEKILDKHKGKDIISLVEKETYGIARKADFSAPSVKKIHSKIMSQFSNQDYLSRVRHISVDFSAEMLRKTEPSDHIIIQSINGIDELDKSINMLSTRLREWYSLYNPELAEYVTDAEHYAKDVLKAERKEFSIGMDIKKEDLSPIRRLAESVSHLFEMKKEQEGYLEAIMRDNYPNFSAVATPLIGARLLSYAGSLRRLINFPSSTVQTLGAEKAMFRHLKSGSKPPKFGIIVLHPLVNDAKKSMRGRVARTLASKILIAAKVDYFRGDSHTGYQLLDEIEKMFP